MNLKYIESQEIINEVKNEISTYFEKGMLDTSYLYPVIRTCLSKMGLKILPTKHDVLKVESYKTDLPCDFYKAVLLVGCGMEEWADIDYLNTKLIEYEVSGTNVCEQRCDYCEDDCGNLYGIRQYFNTYSVTYSELYPLTVSEDSRPYCNDSCFEYRGRGNEVTIKNGKIYTNFETGHIYLEYLTNLEADSGDLMIPDVQVIKDWIKMEMMFVCFRKLYLNGEADVQQRLGWVTQQLAIHQTNATSLYKSWTVKEFYDLRKTLYSRFHKYNTSVYGKYYHYPVSAKSIEERRRQSLGLYA